MADKTTSATTAEKSDQADSRRKIAFEANHQIEKLAGLLKEHYMKTASEDWPVYEGLLGRIQQLSEVIYFAADLGGPLDEVGGPSAETLRQFLDGHLGLILRDEA